MFFACVSLRMTSNTEVFRTAPAGGGGGRSRGSVDVCTMRSSARGFRAGRQLLRLEASPLANSSALIVGAPSLKWHRASVPMKQLIQRGRCSYTQDIKYGRCMTVLTNELTWCTLGFGIRGDAMRFNARLSRTTTQSASPLIF